MKSLLNLLAVRGAAVLVATVSLTAAAATMPAPGTINYTEGQVMLDGMSLAASAATPAVVAPNQILATGQGMAEMLLTPGAFFRLGPNSQVRMISPGLADTALELVKGSAMVEAAELFKENNLTVTVNGVSTRIDKKGLYEFNGAPAVVSVLDGEATVTEGPVHENLKKGHRLVLAGQLPKSQKFDLSAVEIDPLYRWSALRSEYESEANIATAQDINDGGGWFGDGWYWDPYWASYAFLPGDGFLYSPFGWGFYAPGCVWRAPHNFYPHQPVGGSRGVVTSAMTGRASAGRVHSTVSGHTGGGFSHSGGGFAGFHGGGGGGGFHGGGGGGGHR